MKICLKKMLRRDKCFWIGRSHQFDRYIYQSLQFSTAVHLYYKAVQDRPIVELDHVILAPAPQSAYPAGLVNNRPLS